MLKYNGSPKCICAYLSIFADKKDMPKFTEYYYDDALRFAMYIKATQGGEIEIVQQDPEGFPTPPKGCHFKERIDCVKCGQFEIAYFAKRQSPDEDKKHINRNLYRYIVGEKLKEAREAKGLTLEDVAERSGFKPNNIRNIEQGRYGADIELFCRLLEAMGVNFYIKD